MPKLFLLLLAALLWAVPANAGEPLRVVASFSVLADLVRQVGGEHVAVASLIPPGGEPHDWEPRPRDVAALAGADLVVVNGLGLEGWLDRLVAAAGYRGPVVVASRDVAPILDRSGRPDPHAWHSIARVGLYLRAITDGLIAAVPQHEAAFIEGRDAYARILLRLGNTADRAIAEVPPDRRVAFTTHGAFSYLARDHGIAILSPAGPNSAAQPSAKRLAELVARVRAAGVTAVFREAGADARLANVLAAEAGVAVGGELYAGALSGPDGPAATVAEMWRHNVFLMLDAMAR